MKKLLKGGGLAAVLSMAIFIAACSGNEIKRINNSWGVDLPTDMELEYSFDSTGWFGDSVYYYVCDTQKNGLGVNFTEGAASQVEEIIAYNQGLLENIGSEYLADCSHDLSLWTTSENDGNDSLNLIYDNDISKLIILEIHI